METPTNPVVEKNIATASLKGEVSKEKVEAWKREHGKVFMYIVDGKVAYLRPVDRNVYSLATKKMETAPAKFNETVIEGIWLGGDDSIRKDDRYYFGLIDFIEELMAKKKGTLSEA